MLNRDTPHVMCVLQLSVQLIFEATYSWVVLQSRDGGQTKGHWLMAAVLHEYICMPPQTITFLSSGIGSLFASSLVRDHSLRLHWAFDSEGHMRGGVNGGVMKVRIV